MKVNHYFNKIKNGFTKLYEDESGQGTAEYVLLLVVVVALVMAFKGQIMSALNDKLGSLSSDIKGFTGD